MLVEAVASEAVEDDDDERDMDCDDDMLLLLLILLILLWKANTCVLGDDDDKKKQESAAEAVVWNADDRIFIFVRKSFWERNVVDRTVVVVLPPTLLVLLLVNTEANTLIQRPKKKHSTLAIASFQVSISVFDDKTPQSMKIYAVFLFSSAHFQNTCTMVSGL
jgi:hypothetical protein